MKLSELLTDLKKMYQEVGDAAVLIADLDSPEKGFEVRSAMLAGVSVAQQQDGTPGVFLETEDLREYVLSLS